MAFVCTIVADSSHSDVFRDGNEYAIHVPIGTDDAEYKNYSVVVGLSPAPPGQHEYFFAIIEVTPNPPAERWIWSSLEASQIFVQKEDRQKIMDLVLRMSYGLVNHVKPAVFSMATFDDNLPDEALEKYRLLTHLFTDCGYTCCEADPYNGRHLWWMERTSK